MVRNVFTPMGWQIPVWRDKSKVILLTGGAGGGKTHIALEKLHALAMMFPNAKFLIVRKTLQSLYATTLNFFETVVIKELDFIKHNQKKRIYLYPNGSEIHYTGMEDEKCAQRIRGMNLCGVLIDEANSLTENDYNEIAARLRGTQTPFLQIMLCTNPDAPSHWINKRMIEKGEATVYKSDARQNKYNPPEYFEFLDSLTGVYRARLRDGKWVQAEGAVYPEFDRRIHVRDTRKNPLYLPKGWPRYMGIDFGYTNPFICIWACLDPHQDILYIYRELRRVNLLVEDAAKIINEYSVGEEYISVEADHDAEGRATLAKYGIRTNAAYKEVEPGIEALRLRLRSNRLIYLDNALIAEDPILREQKKPLNFYEEMETYIWEPPKPGKVLKEVPMKLNDHAIDATRYIIAKLDNITNTSISALELQRLNANKQGAIAEKFNVRNRMKYQI